MVRGARLGMITAQDNVGRVVAKDLTLSYNQYRSNEPLFVKAYFEDLGQLLSVHKGDIRTLIHLMEYMSYGNVVDISPRIKDCLIKTMGHGTHQTVTNSIHRLKKAFLIIPVRRGSYIIDPKLFAKGRWSDVVKIQLKITYKKDGSKVYNTDFNEQVEDIYPNDEFYDK